MTDLQYEEIKQLSRAEIEEALASGNEKRMADALYSATCDSEDWLWPQELCLNFITSPLLLVRWAAATCLGDIAMLRRKLDKRSVVAALEKAKKDPTIAAQASESLEMILEFIPD